MSSRFWYAYTGNDGGESVLSNYSGPISPAVVNAFCPGGPHLCAIYVAGPGIRNSAPYPNFFTTNMQAYVIYGKMMGVAQPINTPPYYVYMKS